MSNEITRRRFLQTGAGAGVAAAAAFSVVHAAGEKTAPQGGAAARRNMIVDSHVHLRHGDAAHTEYSPEVIVDTMDKARIDKSVVFAMSTTTKRSVQMAEDAVTKFPHRLIPYVYALPNYERPVLPEIEEALSRRAFRGIKIHAGECTLAEYVIDPVLKLAGRHRVPCLIDCMGKHAAAKRICQAFPETKIIIAHMGQYLSTDKGLVDQFIRLAENCQNVLLDVSGVVLLEKVKEAVARIGSQRLVWGTDGPKQKPDTVGFARQELDRIRQLRLGEEDEENILGRTIINLLEHQQEGAAAAVKDPL